MSDELSFGDRTAAENQDLLPSAKSPYPGADMQEVMAAAEILESNGVLKRVFNSLSAANVDWINKFANLSKDAKTMEMALGEIKNIIPRHTDAPDYRRWERISEIILTLEKGTYVHPDHAKITDNPTETPKHS
jgi:hypothetical protein